MASDKVFQTPASGQWSVFAHVRWQNLVSGISGGIASTLLLHPLDLVKIRFEVNDGSKGKHHSYRGLVDAFRTISREEGYLGLYKGVSPNMWGAGAAWGLYFFFYSAMKAYCQEGDASRPFGPGLNVTVGALAGVSTLCFTNPIWVVKTRMCLQLPGQRTATGKPVRLYRGMLHGLSSLYQEEGLRGFYKGFVPGLVGVSHGTLQFLGYEQLKQRYCLYSNIPYNSQLDISYYLLFSALSKLFAATGTYPYQVVRARLMDQQSSFTGMVDVVQRTWRYEGARGFYKGLFPNLLRVTPATCITFVVYEKMSHWLLAR